MFFILKNSIENHVWQHACLNKCSPLVYKGVHCVRTCGNFEN